MRIFVLEEEPYIYRNAESRRLGKGTRDYILKETNWPGHPPLGLRYALAPVNQQLQPRPTGPLQL